MILTHKLFIKLLLFVVCAFFVLFAGINYCYDPLMATGITRNANRLVPVIDARIQKTNRLLRGQANYDALLMGSSRVEQFRQEDFESLKVFNYGVPSVYPREYVDYIDLFLRTNRNTSAIFFLGFDFYGSNSIEYTHASNPAYYIKNSSSLLDSLKFLLSKDSFKYSHIMWSGGKKGFFYDRESLNKIAINYSQAEFNSLLKSQLEDYNATLYGKYSYNEQYKKVLQHIKMHSNGARIVIFTTPVSNDLFRILVENERMDDYERWLTDLVSTFGEVYNFMQPGSFSGDHGNFIDAHHLYPEKAAPVVRLISGKTINNKELSDCLITSTNIRQKLAAIRQNAEGLRRRPGQ